MKIKLNLIAALLIAFFVSSCSFLQNVSQTSIPKNRSHPVDASSDKFVILLLNFNNDFVSEVKEDLKRKCPGGRVEGITSKTESVVYFPILVSRYIVSAHGYCQTQAKPNKN